LAVRHRLLQSTLKLWRAFTEPIPSIQDKDRRQRSRLLASLSLFIFLATVCIWPLWIVVTWNAPTPSPVNFAIASSLILMFFAYMLSRRGYTNAAITMLLVTGTAIIFLRTVISQGEAIPGGLYYLVILSLFGGVFLPLRTAFLIFLIHMLMMLTLGFRNGSGIFSTAIAYPFTFNLIVSSIALLVTYSARRMEVERRTQLEISESRYRNLVNNLHEMVYEYALDGTIISINASPEVMGGWTTQELVGQPIQDFIHPDDFIKVLERLSSQGEVVEVNPPLELRMRNKDGSYRIFEFRSTPQVENGVWVSIAGLGRDITQRKLTENELNESREFVQKITDTAPVIITVYDLIESSVIFMNRFGIDFFEQPLAIIEDKQNDFLASVIHPDDQRIRIEAVDDWLPIRPSHTLVVEHRMRDAQGEWRWFRSHHVVFNRDANGNPVQLLIHSRDITEQQESEAKAVQLMIQREHMTLVNRFVLALSHEFRTSLATIETSRYLADRHLNDASYATVRAKLDSIKQSVERMGDQLQNLYTVNSLSDPRIRPFDVQILIRDSMDELSMKAADKKLQVTLRAAADLPPVLADPEKLRIAIHHLLLNAISYTSDEGQVEIAASAGDGTISIRVRDTGSGIDQKDLPYIFDLFYRADPSRTVESGGIGVGLSIVKMIADANRGTIEVETELDKGSTFTLTLPAAR
jgi:PAS domain S-box-containing protein